MSCVAAIRSGLKAQIKLVGCRVFPQQAAVNYPQHAKESEKNLIYPLGLGLLLQLIAIGGRKQRWALPLSITGWLVIAVPAMPVVSDALLRQLEDQAAALTPKSIPKADAVLVLGGGIRPAPTKGLGVEVNEAGDRLLCGVRLWKQGKAPVLITSGAVSSFMQ